MEKLESTVTAHKYYLKGPCGSLLGDLEIKFRKNEGGTNIYGFLSLSKMVCFIHCSTILIYLAKNKKYS